VLMRVLLLTVFLRGTRDPKSGAEFPTADAASTVPIPFKTIEQAIGVA